MAQLTQPKGMVSKETNKEAIARVFGLRKRQVGYLSTSAAVDSYTVLYDEDTQTCWFRGSATGTPVSWNVTDGIMALVTSVGSFSLTPANLRQNLGSGEDGMGDALLAVKQPYIGSVARTQHDKNWDSLNLLDFVYATDVVDGFVDYGLGLNRAIAAMASLGSTSVEHIPRRRINLPAGLLHIKTKVQLTFGPFAMCGEGIYQTVFTIHPSAASDDDYLFDFSSSGWSSTGRVRISELYLSDFTVLGETPTWIRKKIFKFYGVGWDFAVENVQVWSPPLSAFDMTDTMDGVF
ncbi:TPA: hypothetical protein MA058_003586, partial [Klebsiella pneumoniae]|nr:hypothetical protein [Klebsiella pneumoniae]